ncbi:MAG: primosomal protein N' [Burkholderiales bacterium]|nr:primosomal protein N' [Burkholderiales bacterium]
MPIVQVALDLPLAKTFDFLAVDVTGDDVGRLVVVPFGSKKMAGVIVGLSDVSEVPRDKLKAVILVQRALPKFSARDFALFGFCESYYHHPLGPIALSALPPGMRLPKLMASRQQRVIDITTQGREALAKLSAKAVAQRTMLSAIVEVPQAEAQLKLRHARAASVLSALLKKGWVVASEVARGPVSRARKSATISSGPLLRDEQQRAVDQINAARGTFTPFLLFGVTASGKTEVYLRVIADALASGLQALVLVPEINLTPQFLRQVKLRFPDAHIVEQNSGMADVPRMTGYLDAQTGLADIVIGTRLAVFTPMPRLGVIVIDEEHDASFKQQEGFRYSARDVAIFRAQQESCVVVLGSATPSLESLHNVARGRFTQITLKQRAAANAVMPTIEFIDLNVERAEDGLSLSLVKAIEATVQRGEQVLIFINRRGFSPALVCAQCGAMPECKRCSARLVFHQKDRRLKCHHCGYQTRVPVACVACGSHEMVAAGQGTERIEEALRAKLPSARIARVDRDSTRKRGAAEKIFDAAAAGEIDVLVGTQMLSKGHDFPNITLVGVVNADGAMFSADFRAAERMVAQLCQVAGRAGRADLAGRVLIQTRFAVHPLYQAVAAQDHAAFAAMAMNERKSANLPPYAYLALLRAEAKSADALNAFMQAAVEAADAARAAQAKQAGCENAALHVWDPIPAPLARKAGFERQQLMVQADSRGALQQFLGIWLPEVRKVGSRAVKWVIDVDPLEV